jgi:hypothetical protein
MLVFSANISSARYSRVTPKRGRGSDLYGSELPEALYVSARHLVGLLSLAICPNNIQYTELLSSSRNASDLYLGGAWFVSLLGHRLSGLTVFFYDFLQSLLQNAEIGHDRFLSHLNQLLLTVTQSFDAV